MSIWKKIGLAVFTFLMIGAVLAIVLGLVGIALYGLLKYGSAEICMAVLFLALVGMLTVACLRETNWLSK